MIVDNPRLLGLPHDKWRPGQKDAFDKALSMYRSGGGTMVIEAPTGTGKSGIATALGSEEETTVLVHNHGLLDQYEKVYGFDTIKGKPEYPCVLKTKVDHWKKTYNTIPTAADCHFADTQMCPVGHNCPYIVARNIALQSKRMACTYKYAALSEAVQKRSGIIVFDEAHGSYEEMLGMSQFVMDQETCSHYKFPKLPLVDFGAGGKGDLLDAKSKSILIDWFHQSLGKIAVTDLFSAMTPDGSKNKRMFERLSHGFKLLTEKDIPLFYKCSKTSGDIDFFAPRQSTLIMQIRSLDVTDLVTRLSEDKNLTILMSATIGNPKPLMKQLGIETYSYHNYPHPIPKDKRPIYILPVDKMTKANLDLNPTLYKKQADSIGQFINRFDPQWRGIVLTTSNSKVGILRDKLKPHLNGRIMNPPANTKLSEQINMFVDDSDPGAIMVANIQGWGSGLSLDWNKGRISVVAGVPYANPGDRFDQIRMSSQVGRDYAFWNAYCAVIQAVGRVSRGEVMDNGDFLLNVAAIADGSAVSPGAMSTYSEWFKEAFVRW